MLVLGKHATIYVVVLTPSARQAEGRVASSRALASGPKQFRAIQNSVLRNSTIYRACTQIQEKFYLRYEVFYIIDVTEHSQPNPNLVSRYLSWRGRLNFYFSEHPRRFLCWVVSTSKTWRKWTQERSWRKPPKFKISLPKIDHLDNFGGCCSGEFLFLRFLVWKPLNKDTAPEGRVFFRSTCMHFWCKSSNWSAGRTTKTKTKHFTSVTSIAWRILTCKRGSVGQSKGLSIPRSSVRFRLKPDNSNAHGFELHRPSNKGTKLLLKVMKAIIIISDFKVPFLHRWGVTIPQALHFLVVKETSLLGLVNPTQEHWKLFQRYPLRVGPELGSGPGQFLRSYVINRMRIIHWVTDRWSSWVFATQERKTDAQQIRF